MRFRQIPGADSMNSVRIPRGSLGAVILVGNPNVGKSVVFGALTGRYVNVSNYPGTTVEVTRGEARDR
ncbi:MAG: 50S ribosome-binding GTPase, partial [Deltaproteobacteria bacterium]|nr:50S ribosome-binding GTPase [Deltaproteobacteria bacterium]